MDEETKPIVPNFGEEIKGSLCAVYVTVKRPSGSVRIDEAVIEAPNTEGEMEAIKSKRVTGKSVRYDFHPLWAAIDDNGREIKRLVNRMTAQSLQRGTYMMSMLTVGSFILTLKELREDRLELVDQLNEKWDEVISEIEDEFPDHYHLFIERIPKPCRARFDVCHMLWPLGTLSDEDLDLSNLTPFERDQVITDTKAAAENLLKDRLQNVFDGVFGAIVEICEDVEKRGFESGKRRQGAVNNIMDILERAKNFSQFADADTLAAIESAYTVVKDLKIQDLNSNVGGIQERLRATFAGVHHEVSKLRQTYEAGSSRMTRKVEL